jgi:hypothetical protein
LTLSGTPRLMTRAHHSQADQQMEWDGIAMDELLAWMMRQGGLPLPQAAEIAATGPTPSEENSALPHLAIANLWVSQVDMAASTADAPFQRMIRVEARIGYTQDEENLPPTPHAVAVDIFLVNTQTNQSIFFENPAFSLSAEADAQDFAYNVPLPPPGRYQLYLLGRSPQSHKTLALQAGPVVNVV